MLAISTTSSQAGQRLLAEAVWMMSDLLTIPQREIEIGHEAKKLVGRF